MRGEIAKLKQRVDQEVTAQKTAADIEKILQEGKAADAAAPPPVAATPEGAPPADATASPDPPTDQRRVAVGSRVMLGEPLRVTTIAGGAAILLPAGVPHAVRAPRPFRMVLTMIRA